jgi:hypothetical protein
MIGTFLHNQLGELFNFMIEIMSVNGIIVDIKSSLFGKFFKLDIYTFSPDSKSRNLKNLGNRRL